MAKFYLMLTHKCISLTDFNYDQFNFVHHSQKNFRGFAPLLRFAKFTHKISMGAILTCIQLVCVFETWSFVQTVRNSFFFLQELGMQLCWAKKLNGRFIRIFHFAFLLRTFPCAKIEEIKLWRRQISLAEQRIRIIFLVRHLNNFTDCDHDENPYFHD